MLTKVMMGSLWGNTASMNLMTVGMRMIHMDRLQMMIVRRNASCLSSSNYWRRHTVPRATTTTISIRVIVMGVKIGAGTMTFPKGTVA